MKTTALVLMLLPAAAAAFEPSSASVTVTAKDTALSLASTGTLHFVPEGQPLESQTFVFVDPSKKFQTLIGIGAAITDAAADTWATLPADKREQVLRAFYDPKSGIGYTFARTNINSCDFSSATYTYVADGDKDLKTFDVAHDRQNRLPMIKRAMELAGGSLKLFASPWSPPAWMKSNGDMLHGGRLKPEYAQSWADYFVKFIRAYRKEGVEVWGVTVQNEPMATQPWESCVFTAEDEKNFVKDHLGPTLAKAGLGDRKLMIWDHNRDLIYQYASTILEDPAAAKYVWGVAYHWYEDWSGGTSMFENVRRVAEAFPDKPLVFTEGTAEKFDPGRYGDWDLGEHYGRELIESFNDGAVAWTDWNVLLDQRGGPNHVDNFCFAALHVDTNTHALTWTNIYPYVGHFSKFIRPGARRVIAAPSRSSLKSTAFLNPDGTLAVVVMNDGDKPVDYSLIIQGRAARTTSLPHSIATFVVR